MLSKLAEIFKPGKGKKTPLTKEAKRYNDAVLIIRQDNPGLSLHIEAANFLALKLLGGETRDIIEKDVRNFVPDNIRQIINENIEFRDYGRSIDSVLGKIANFKVKTLSGSEMPLKIRIIRSMSPSLSAQRFQLVMNDSSLMESLEAHRENYRANMRGDEIIDKKSGLISRHSVVKDIELISFYTERNSKASCFAVFKFINYDDLRLEHDEEGAYKMFSDLHRVIEATKRKQDIMGLAQDGAIVLIFPETPKENIKIPIARIYAKLPKSIKAQLRVYYDVIRPDINAEEQLESCLKGRLGIF